MTYICRLRDSQYIVRTREAEPNRRAGETNMVDVVTQNLPNQASVPQTQATFIDAIFRAFPPAAVTIYGLLSRNYSHHALLPRLNRSAATIQKARPQNG